VEGKKKKKKEGGGGKLVKSAYTQTPPLVPSLLLFFVLAPIYCVAKNASSAQKTQETVITQLI